MADMKLVFAHIPDLLTIHSKVLCGQSPLRTHWPRADPCCTRATRLLPTRVPTVV